MKLNFTKRLVLSAALSSCCLLTSCQKEEMMEQTFIETDTAIPTGEDGRLIEGQYIVIFKKNSALKATTTSELRSSTFSTQQVSEARRKHILAEASLPREAISLVYDGDVEGFAAKLTPTQLAALKEQPDVAYIEQDKVISLGAYRANINRDVITIKDKAINNFPKPGPTPATVELNYTPITPLAGETVPWHIERIGSGDGTGKVVWVIDSGIDAGHPDLNVDMSRGKSFVRDLPSVQDEFGHGTLIAGVIGARNNGSGMVGIAANATLIPLRVFDKEGKGTLSMAIGAVNHAVAYGKAGDVVNMSLGSSTSSIMDDAVRAGGRKGILFSIAAGNTGVDCKIVSPARVDGDNIYTISAMDINNRFWASSNFGAAVDFAAPGVNITSTKLGGGLKPSSSGTSLAAPHVAGILALRGQVYSQGVVTGDKDETPDPIASLR